MEKNENRAIMSQLTNLDLALPGCAAAESVGLNFGVASTCDVEFPDGVGGTLVVAVEVATLGFVEPDAPFVPECEVPRGRRGFVEAELAAFVEPAKPVNLGFVAAADMVVVCEGPVGSTDIIRAQGGQRLRQKKWREKSTLCGRISAQNHYRPQH
jgi:hypothetical protein